MCVVYAWDDQPALEVNDLRMRTDAFFDVGAGANPHETTLFDGNGLGPGSRTKSQEHGSRPRPRAVPD